MTSRIGQSLSTGAGTNVIDITTDATVTIEGLAFDVPQNAKGVKVDQVAATVTIRQSSFTIEDDGDSTNYAFGVKANDGTLTVHNSSFDGSSQDYTAGVKTTDAGTVDSDVHEIHNSTFTDIRYGAQFTGDAALVANNEFTGVTNESVIFSSNYDGLDLADVEVLSNTFDSVGQGVWFLEKNNNFANSDPATVRNIQAI